MVGVGRLLPPRNSGGALSSTVTVAPASAALNAAHKPALPPPTTTTSDSKRGTGTGVSFYYVKSRGRSYLMKIRKWFFVGLAVLTPWLMPAQAQKARPKPLIEELVAANHILANIGVLDAYGHVSVRDDRNP